MATVNMPLGLPRTVRTTDPVELQKILNRVLEVLHAMNGEGDPNVRLVTAKEMGQ